MRELYHLFKCLVFGVKSNVISMAAIQALFDTLKNQGHEYLLVHLYFSLCEYGDGYKAHCKINMYELTPCKII
jgi:hypothetical protein